MKTEAGLVEKKRDTVGHTEKNIRKKRCRRGRKIHHETTESMELQKLYVSCREVFKGPGTVPPPEDVQKLQQILDGMKPEDVGLRRDLIFLKPVSVDEGTPRVTYTTIYQCVNFSLCIFFLPPTAVIPLHNHPGMTVFSKLLFGSMHIKAYDWADLVRSGNPMPSPRMRLARLKADTMFTAPCNTSVLYPTSGGNIHAFTAVTPCVVLDVLGPPYSIEDDRDCTYYRDTPYNGHPGSSSEEAKDGDDSYGWLEEIEMPKDLMDVVEYLGPQIIETHF